MLPTGFVGQPIDLRRRACPAACVERRVGQSRPAGALRRANEPQDKHAQKATNSTKCHGNQLIVERTFPLHP
ncbi:MAG: hypothetical protein ACK55I_00200 [bacterium]